jgi:hypothetical protein
MKTALEHARKWMPREEFERLSPHLINPEGLFAQPTEALIACIPFDMMTSGVRKMIDNIRKAYLRELVIQARRLADNIDSLNPNCLSLGPGMMQHLKALSKEIMSL